MAETIKINPNAIGAESIELSKLASSIQESLTQADNSASKVDSAVNGDFAALDENGDLTDSGYKPSDYYIKSEVDALIGSIESFHYEIYPSLSDIQTPQTNVLYLIGPSGSGSDLYEEYVYKEGQSGSEGEFVKIGETSIDLSGYTTDAELATALANYTTTTDLNTLLSGKVDAVSGKGLSTEDYTTAEKTKLSGIESGAKDNVVVLDAYFTRNEESEDIFVLEYKQGDVTEDRLNNIIENNKIPIINVYIDLGDNTYEEFITITYSGKSFIDEDNYSYHFINTSSDSGEYKCLFYNDGTTFTGILALMVYLSESSLVSEIIDDNHLIPTSEAVYNALNLKANSSDLATVATSGSYNDLSDKPNIPVITGKADKVSGATSGNFAGLDSNGNLTDSGYSSSSFATAAQGSKADTAYQKPSAGIPKTDLASGVQTSLGLADTALQSHQDITGKADKVNNPTSGNFAGLDSNGNLTDSGSKASDFATASSVSTIEGKIPTQATSSNQLADKAFVNSSIQTATATFRGTWSTWADVPADNAGDSSGYGVVDSDNNDYLVVRDASGYGPAWDSAIAYLEDDIVYYYDEMDASHGGLYKCIAGGTVEEPYLLNDWVKIDKNPDYLGTWRFKYVPEGQTYSKDNWKPEYQVNEEPLTAAQVAAINSGITSTLVSEFGAKYDKPSGGIPKTDLASAVQTSLGLADSAVQDVTGKADKVSGASNGNFAGLDSNGNLTDSGYDATDFVLNTNSPFENGSGSNSAVLKNSGSSATEEYSVAEGYKTIAYGYNSHSEGEGDTALQTLIDNGRTPSYDDWINYQTYNAACGKSSHSEGGNTIAVGYQSHAEGWKTAAKGSHAHSEGDHTTALGHNSHAEGLNTTASGQVSHAEGNGTQTTNNCEHAEGIYNKSNTSNDAKKRTLHSTGIGTADNDRKNAFEIMRNGEIYICGVGGYDGTNPSSKVNSLQKVLENLGVTIDWTKLGY